MPEKEEIVRELTEVIGYMTDMKGLEGSEKASAKRPAEAPPDGQPGAKFADTGADLAALRRLLMDIAPV